MSPTINSQVYASQIQETHYTGPFTSSTPCYVRFS